MKNVYRLGIKLVCLTKMFYGKLVLEYA